MITFKFKIYSPAMTVTLPPSAFQRFFSNCLILRVVVGILQHLLVSAVFRVSPLQIPPMKKHISRLNSKFKLINHK